MSAYVSLSRTGSKVISVPSEGQIRQNPIFQRAVSSLLTRKTPDNAVLSDLPQIFAETLEQAESEGIEFNIQREKSVSIFLLVCRAFYGEGGENYCSIKHDAASKRRWRQSGYAAIKGLVECDEKERWHSKTVLRIQIILAYWLLEDETLTLNCLGQRGEPQTNYVDACARIFGPPLDLQGYDNFAGLDGTYCNFSSSHHSIKVTNWLKVSKTQYAHLLSFIVLTDGIEVPDSVATLDSDIVVHTEQMNHECMFGAINLDLDYSGHNKTNCPPGQGLHYFPVYIRSLKSRHTSLLFLSFHDSKFEFKFAPVIAPFHEHLLLNKIFYKQSHIEIGDENGEFLHDPKATRFLALMERRLFY